MPGACKIDILRPLVVFETLMAPLLQNNPRENCGLGLSTSR